MKGKWELLYHRIRIGFPYTRSAVEADLQTPESLKPGGLKDELEKPSKMFQTRFNANNDINIAINFSSVESLAARSSVQTILFAATIAASADILSLSPSPLYRPASGLTMTTPFPHARHISIQVHCEDW